MLIFGINRALHSCAPKFGEHGALTSVDGRENTWIIDAAYPAILKKDKDQFAYVGQYKVVSQKIVPAKIWQTWPDGHKTNIAREIIESTWGKNLLMKRNIKLQGMTEKDRVDEILGFFKKPSNEPNLRMKWAVLEFVEFSNFMAACVKDLSSSSEIPQITGLSTPPSSINEPKRKSPDDEILQNQAKRSKTGPLEITGLSTPLSVVNEPKRKISGDQIVQGQSEQFLTPWSAIDDADHRVQFGMLSTA